MNWQKANLGAACGKSSPFVSDHVRSIQNAMHMTLSLQMHHEWFFRNFDERRCDLPMSQLFDNSREVWKR